MWKWTIAFGAELRRLRRNRKGAVAVMTALTVTSLLGVAGLGTDATLWFVAKRNLQGAADVAAYSAATAEVSGANATAFTAAAKAVAASYGFTDGTNGVSVAVNNPPASGAYTTNSSAVEVIISQPQPLFFSSLFLSAQPTARSRAVATEGANGNGCVMALDRGDVSDVTDVGNTTLSLNGCSLYVNSDSSSALQIKGTATITAYSAFITGNYSKDSEGTFTTSHGVSTGVSPANNPYANVPVPSFSGCNQSSYKQTGGTKSLGPGSSGGTYVFCNGVNLTGASTLNLTPGTYVIDRGGFSMEGQTSIACPTCSSTSGVTIVLTSSTGSSYGSVSIAGGATISLNAPPTGSTAGITFFQDPNAPTSGSNTFEGGSSQNITGAIYFPNQEVIYTGGASTGSTNPCTQIIAFTLEFKGTSNVNSSCTNTGVRNIGMSPSKLVE